MKHPEKKKSFENRNDVKKSTSGRVHGKHHHHRGGGGRSQGGARFREDVDKGEDVTAANEEADAATMTLQLQRMRDPVLEPTPEIQRSLTTTLIITLTIA